MASALSQLVDRWCDELFLSRRAREQDDNLQFVRNRLLRSEVDLAGLLDLYRQVQRGRPVKDDETSPLARVLRLSGVVRVEKGLLRVRNRIYDRAFDREWVLAHMPGAELRRQRAAYRRGLLRATAISAVIVAAMAALSLLAVRQTRRAREATAQRTIALQQAVKERNHAEHETRLAREAERQTKVALRQAEARRREAELQRQEAKRRGEEALRQAKIARAREAEAQGARQAATERLRDSYLSQAHARRWSGQPGQRFESLIALTQAARLHPPEALRLQLRNEAIACMALPTDLQRVRYWESSHSRRRVVAIDLDRRRTLQADLHGTLTLHRLADDHQIARLPAPVVRLRGVYRASPEGRFLVGQHSQAEPHMVWDLTRGQRVRPVTGALYWALDFCPDGRRFAVGQRDRRVHLYELPSGKELQSVSPGLVPNSLAFHPDGRHLAVTDYRAVRVVDLMTGEGVSLPCPGPVARFAWSPGGRMLAGSGSVGNDHIYIWNVEARHLVADLTGHRDHVVVIAFSRGGDLLASSSWDNTVRVWDPLTGRLLLTQPGYVETLQFSRNDQWLAGTSPHEAWVWKVADRRPLRTLWGLQGANPSNRLWSVAFSPDGRLIVSGEDKGARLWDAAAGKEMAFLSVGHTRSALFSPDGRSLITSSGSQSGLQRWPIAADGNGAHSSLRIGPPERFAVPAPWAFLYAAQSRDGSVLAAVGCEPGDPVPRRAYVFDGKSVTPRFSVEGNPAMQNLDVSPDGRWIATTAWNGTDVHIWDTRLRRAHRLGLRSRALAQFSPDGKWLVSGADEGLRFWEVGTWRPGRWIPREPGMNASVLIAFTGDGRMMAIHPSDAVVRLIDSATGREIATLELPDPRQLSWLCFSPDGATLALVTWHGGIRLWDLRLIRQRLAAMGLDWDLPPYPPSRQGTRGADSCPLSPLRVRVVAGRVDHTP